MRQIIADIEFESEIVDAALILDILSVPENFTGVARTQSGNYFWFKNGKRHREDGPAVIWKEGDVGWRLDGRIVSEIEVFERATPEQQLKMIWKMGQWNNEIINEDWNV